MWFNKQTRCRILDSAKSWTTSDCRREEREEWTPLPPETPLTFPTTTVWANQRWGSLDHVTPPLGGLTYGYAAVRACAGGAGPAVDRRGQLPDRVWEEAGEGTRHQSPSSCSPVQKINLDWCQEDSTQTSNRSPVTRFLLYSSGKNL